jgi:hypothetical protein
MSDESQQIPAQQENPQTLTPSNSIAPQPPKSKRNTWILAGAVVSILCLCSIVCVAVFGAGMFNVFKQKAPVESVLDAYMGHMANKDASSAYALFTPRAQRQIPFSEIQDLLKGNNYFLFEGYQSLSVDNINISATVNPDPDVPQGIVAEVTGTITYEGDVQGTFEGVLEKVGEEWMIDGMYVVIPPSKVVALTCADLSLTPEEDANCGTHTYQLEEKLTSYCSTMDVDNKVIDVKTFFSGNTMTTSIHDWEFTRKAENEYEHTGGKISSISNINRHVHTITLTLNGFTENYAYEGPEGNLIDCWLDTYTIIK